MSSEGWGGGGEGGDVDATKMMRLDEANFLEFSGPLFFLSSVHIVIIG